MRKKTKNKDSYKDCWVYILLLTTLVILTESLKYYSFPIAGVSLSYSIFLLPFVYFITNYIDKKYDYKKAISSIAISGVLFVCYSAIISFGLGQRLILSSISGEFIGYVISQLVNLTIFNFIQNNTKSPLLLIYLNYIFSLIVYYMFYTLIYLKMILLDQYWKGYFLTLIIQIIICIPIAIVDKKIKRGIE